MQILLILYKSGLDLARVKQLFQERASKYRQVPGLRQKFYLHERSTDRVGGIYVFDTLAHLEQFKGSDLERSIQATYRFTEPASMQVFDVVHALRDESP